MFTFRVTDCIDAHRNRDRTSGRDEDATKRIEVEADADQGNQPVDLQMTWLAEDDAEAEGQANRSQDGCEASGQCGSAGPSIRGGGTLTQRRSRV